MAVPSPQHSLRQEAPALEAEEQLQYCSAGQLNSSDASEVQCCHTGRRQLRGQAGELEMGHGINEVEKHWVEDSSLPLETTTWPRAHAPLLLPVQLQ